jgi:hypothetical protein
MPGSLSSASVNSNSSNHTHAVTASSTPNGTATLLKTNNVGGLQYVELQHSTIGVPGEAADTSMVMTFNHRNQLANAGLSGIATYSVNGGTAVPLGNNPFDGSSGFVSIAAAAGDDVEIVVEIPTLVSNYASAKWHPLVAMRYPLNNLTALQPSTIEAFVSNDGITWYYASGDGWKTTSPETSWRLGGRMWLGTSAVPTLPVALPGYTWRYAKFVLGDLVGGTSYAYVWLAHLGMIHTSHPGIPDFIGPNGGSIYNRLSFLTPSIGSTTANAYIDEDGSAKFDDVALTGNIQANNYVSRTTGWQVSYAGNADFRDIFADTLEVQTFIVDNVLATAGTEILTKSLSILSRDFTTAVWGIIYVFDLPGSPDVRVFADGDTIRLRSIDRTAGLIVSDVYGRVSNYTNLVDGEQSYEFDKVSGTDGLVIYAGSTVLDYGESGDGFIISTVADTYSPYTDVRTWATTIDNDSVHVRVGSLQGITYEDEFGIYAGMSPTRHVTLSDTNLDLHGVNISMYEGATETIRIDQSIPAIKMGNPLPAAFGDDGIWFGYSAGVYKARIGNAIDYLLWDSSKLELHGSRLSLYQGASETIRIDQTVPAIKIGNPLPINFGDTGMWFGNSAGIYKARIGDANDYVLWDGSLLTVAGKLLIDGASEFVGVATLGTSGGIYQGTGTFASPTTGLKLWNDGGAGRIAGYNTGVLQAGFDTSGRFTAGGGNVILDDDGLSLFAQIASSPESNITWFIGSTEQATISVYSNPTIFGGNKFMSILNEHVATRGSYITIEGTSDAGYQSDIRISANEYGTLASADIFLQSNADGVYGEQIMLSANKIVAYGSLVGNEGISVGGYFTPAAGTGNVLYTGDLLARRSSTNYAGYIYVPKTSPTYAWTGVTRNAATTYTITYTQLGIPLNAKAAEIRWAFNSASINYRIRAGYNNADPIDIDTVSPGIATFARDGGKVNMTVAGNTYFRSDQASVASGAYLWCTGYYI